MGVGDGGRQQVVKDDEAGTGQQRTGCVDITYSQDEIEILMRAGLVSEECINYPAPVDRGTNVNAF